MFCQVRVQVRDQQPTFTVRFELPGRRKKLASLLRILPFGVSAGSLPFVLLQSRFVIERVDVRWSSAHAEEDHSFRFRFEVRRLRQQRVRRQLLLRRGGGSEPRKGHVPKAARNGFESVAASEFEHGIFLLHVSCVGWKKLRAVPAKFCNFVLPKQRCARSSLQSSVVNCFTRRIETRHSQITTEQGSSTLSAA